MPVRFGLWRGDSGSARRVPASAITSEERLETIIEAQIDILGLGDLMQIGRQVWVLAATSRHGGPAR